MSFESVATGGCRSYLVGCGETCAAALIDPELGLRDRYLALGAKDSLRIRYLVDTHTHADHFSGTRELAQRLQAPIVMRPARGRPSATGGRSALSTPGCRPHAPRRTAGKPGS